MLIFIPWSSSPAASLPRDVFVMWCSLLPACWCLIMMRDGEAWLGEAWCGVGSNNGFRVFVSRCVAARRVRCSFPGLAAPINLSGLCLQLILKASRSGAYELPWSGAAQ